MIIIIIVIIIIIISPAKINLFIKGFFYSELCNTLIFSI